MQISLMGKIKKYMKKMYPKATDLINNSSKKIHVFLQFY